MKDTWRAGLKSLEVERNIANLHHYAERSRHHTKDKQRLVVSVVAYDSLPRHQATLLCARLRFCAVGLACRSVAVAFFLSCKHQFLRPIAGHERPRFFECKRITGSIPLRFADQHLSRNPAPLVHGAMVAVARLDRRSCSRRDPDRSLVKADVRRLHQRTPLGEATCGAGAAA